MIKRRVVWGGSCMIADDFITMVAVAAAYEQGSEVEKQAQA